MLRITTTKTYRKGELLPEGVTEMLNADFNLRDDIIGLTTMRKNLAQIVDEVETDHSQKVIIRNGKPSVMLVSVDDFQDMQDQLLALELQLGLRQALEEEKRGELIELDDLAAEFGIDMSQFDYSEKPEGYDQMIPQRFRDAS